MLDVKEQDTVAAQRFDRLPVLLRGRPDGEAQNPLELGGRPLRGGPGPEGKGE